MAFRAMARVQLLTAGGGFEGDGAAAIAISIGLGIGPPIGVRISLDETDIDHMLLDGLTDRRQQAGHIAADG